MRPPWPNSSNPLRKINPVGPSPTSSHFRLPETEIQLSDDVIAPGDTPINVASRRKRWILPKLFPFRLPAAGRHTATYSGKDDVVVELDKVKDVVVDMVAGGECGQLLGGVAREGSLQIASMTRGLPSHPLKFGHPMACHLGESILMLGPKLKILLDDVVAVSCYEGSRLLTVHTYIHSSTFCFPSACAGRNPQRDITLLAPSSEDAWQWISAFSSLGCHVRVNPHSLFPLAREGTAPTTIAGSAGPKPTHGYLPFSGEQHLELSPALEASRKVQRQGHGEGNCEEVVVGEEASVGGPWPPLHVRPVSVMAVFVNPRSGRGLARKVFHSTVKPILELAGFKLTVYETTGVRHAQQMAASMDLSTCPQGIVCVGGDGLVNEVLNGLYIRPDSSDALALPLGVIPAGSDNSLVFSVFGIRDPVAAAMAIVKGGLLPVDAFLLQWEEGAGRAQIGTNSVYFGFMSNVLALSARYQRTFGPLKYLVGGVIGFMQLKTTNCTVHFLPHHSQRDSCTRSSSSRSRSRVMQSRSTADVAPAAEAHSSNAADAGSGAVAAAANQEEGTGNDGDSLPASPPEPIRPVPSTLLDLNPMVAAALKGLQPLRHHSSSHGSGGEYVRGKQSPPASPWVEDEEELALRGHRRSALGGKGGGGGGDGSVGHGGPAVTSRSLRRSGRSSSGHSRQTRGWMPLEEDSYGGGGGGAVTDGSCDNTDCESEAESSRAAAVAGSSSAPTESPIKGLVNLPGSSSSSRTAGIGCVKVEDVPEEGSSLEVRSGRSEDGQVWSTRQGPFLAVIACSHPCQTVQCFDSLKLAPSAVPDDGLLDLILVKPLSHVQFLRFLVLLQIGQHVTLPNVEYVKCQAVRVIPDASQHSTCGVDGELHTLDGPILVEVLKKKCVLIGQPKVM